MRAGQLPVLVGQRRRDGGAVRLGHQRAHPRARRGARFAQQRNRIARPRPILAEHGRVQQAELLDDLLREPAAAEDADLRPLVLAGIVLEERRRVRAEVRRGW